MEESRPLVICYGNALRGDDGVALRVAELLAADATLDPEAVDVRCVAQLDVAFAAEIARAPRVIFVDAEPVDPEDLDEHAGPVQPRLIPIAPDAPRNAFRPNVHALTPHDLVVLTKRLYGHAPTAVLVAVPAYDMSHGEELTEEAECAARSAARVVHGLLRPPGGPHV